MTQPVEPFNPSREELREWAYGDHDGMWPVEDWDIIVAEEQDADLYFELAGDPACPHRDTFLHFLHILVAEHFRPPPPALPLSQRLQDLLAQGEAAEDGDLRAWARRSRELIADPTRFDYDTWFGGTLVWRRPGS